MPQARYRVRPVSSRRADHTLERTMIRFDDVVEVFRGPVLDILGQQPFAL
jgi:hypothetical protein